MSRKKFIESQGATCKNWTWSWSFVNHKKKIVIFGAWDTRTDGNISLILSDTWNVNAKGRKLPAYAQSREHIRLVEEEGYELQTFPMIYSDQNKDENGIGPSKIQRFVPELKTKYLKRVGGNWYASDGQMSSQLPEEIDNPQSYIEGAVKTISVNTYERSSDARAKCIAHYGYSCAVCGFSFEAVYGPIGEKYIHVHHIVPLSEIGSEYELNPTKDLVPVCANCHAIIHRTKPALTVKQLKEYLSKHHESPMSST